MSQILTTTLAKKATTLFFMVMLMIPINYYFGVIKVEAGPAGGRCGALNSPATPCFVHKVTDTSATSVKTAVESTLTTISTTATSLSTGSLALKENFLDGLWHLAAKIFLRAIVRSVIQWINSGFKGAPTFVTDLKGFLVDVADEIAGEFIYQSDALRFLCSPFQLDIRIALANTYSKGRTNNYQPQCTLTGVVNNVQNFMDGSFQDGGWPGWVELSISEESNPQKAYYNASAELYAGIITAQGEEVKLLDFGDGFFSLETCDVAQYGTSAAPNCTIGTPGSVIAERINSALGAEEEALITADEVNEVFNALIMQVFNQLFQGAYGLLGLGGNPSYTNYNWDTTGTYSSTSTVLDAYKTFDQNTSIDPGNLGGSNPITQAIADEEGYLTAQYDIIGRVDAAENDYNNAGSCSFAFPAGLVSARSAATNEAVNSANVLSILYTIDQAFASSTSATEQQNVLQQFYDTQNQGLLHNQTDVVAANLYIQYDLQLMIDDLNTKIGRNCS